ncbi:MAG TPA: hypothetical protein VHB21_19420, partial [Minicystis sp.]|nr:hypothetical protein [Minicystis sp.]
MKQTLAIILSELALGGGALLVAHCGKIPESTETISSTCGAVTCGFTTSEPRTTPAATTPSTTTTTTTTYST